MAAYVRGRHLLHRAALRNLEAFPNPSHAAIMRFFVDWLDARDLEVEKIYGAHGVGPARAEHLEKIRAMTR